ncbi:SDR family oxidoreductase [Dongshaea marina]|uniref:SDR family oxidoreductase n=1 Tax=Dongshaea marina TaxID=2047966 RepID=UPI000D3E5606|nr:SDR family oxidoreductase [Dongshaea marina]
MSSRVVITGANRGIGLELCRHYCQQGTEVYALCRHSSDELNKLPVTLIEGIDIGQPDVIERLKNALPVESIDILINNAGCWSDETLGSLDYASIERSFSINTLGPLRITEACLDKLHSGSKIAMITSRMGSIADNGSGGRYGYRISKAGLNAASVSLALDLKPREIAVAIIHPGYVQTDMTSHHGNVTPDQSAAQIAQRIAELDLNNSGSFWHANGEQLPW